MYASAGCCMEVGAAMGGGRDLKIFDGLNGYRFAFFKGGERARRERIKATKGGWRESRRLRGNYLK